MGARAGAGVGGGCVKVNAQPWVHGWAARTKGARRQGLLQSLTGCAPVLRAPLAGGGHPGGGPPAAIQRGGCEAGPAGAAGKPHGGAQQQAWTALTVGALSACPGGTPARRLCQATLRASHSAASQRVAHTCCGCRCTGRARGHCPREVPAGSQGGGGRRWGNSGEWLSGACATCLEHGRLSCSHLT